MRGTIYFDPLFLTTIISGVVASAIWLLALIDYMAAESNSKQYVVVSKLLIVLDAVYQLAEFLFLYTRDTSYPMLPRWVHYSKWIATLLISIVIALLIVKIVKRVFYARSGWWIFIEVFVVPIGMITLTPDVQKWERGPKE